jgi:hypothetical protein
MNNPQCLEPGICECMYCILRLSENSRISGAFRLLGASRGSRISRKYGTSGLLERPDAKNIRSFWRLRILLTSGVSGTSIMSGTVRDLLNLVHNVILKECIFRSGNPRGSGFWVKGNRWATEGTKGVSLRATGSRGGRILTRQGGFQVSKQGEQGEQGADHVHKLNYI